MSNVASHTMRSGRDTLVVRLSALGRGAEVVGLYAYPCDASAAQRGVLVRRRFKTYLNPVNHRCFTQLRASQVAIIRAPRSSR